MLELIHAVLTSLLLSAGMGCPAGQAVAGEDEPVDSENGVDMGSMPSHLASTRSHTSSNSEQSDDEQPASISIHTRFCEPTVWVDASLAAVQAPQLEVGFSTSGRSP